MNDDNKIPNTVSSWATRENGKDIPRSARENVYQPPLNLGDFKAHVIASDIYAPVKAAILDEIEKYKASRDQDRSSRSMD